MIQAIELLKRIQSTWTASCPLSNDEEVEGQLSAKALYLENGHVLKLKLIRVFKLTWDVKNPKERGHKHWKRHEYNARDVLSPGSAYHHEIILGEEIKDGCGYRLHKAHNDFGKLVLVKAFSGPSRNENYTKNIDAQKQFWHSNIAHFSNEIIDGPRLYLVYPQLDPNLPCDLMEYAIAQELKIGLVEGIKITLKTVVGIAKAINFLRQAVFPLEKARWNVHESFDVVSGLDKKPLLVIHAENLDAIGANGDSWMIQGPADWSVFNTLCNKIFNAANVCSYSDYPEILSQIPRSPFLLQSDAANYGPTWSPFPSATLFTRETLRIRRELSWLVDDTEMLCPLRDIASRFDSILKVPPVLALLPYRQGETGEIVHGCGEYLREEIVLTPRVNGSAVFAYNTPRMMETCIVCGERIVNRSHVLHL
ncbi:hypothetical protein BDQ17DRAFT_1419267 [Cyathus striatus]|nr:hypothetical protein BDQ17DRAFT_1419267 [Cyathus striatus]